MEDLKRHEQFEIEVLSFLNQKRLLPSLVFGGGTMLRLCHELPRYSVDLDFWLAKKSDEKMFFQKLLESFKERYEITDHKNKHFTLLFELRSSTSPSRLKIEIRKEVSAKNTEQQIAHSTHASEQVLVRVFTLEDMAAKKADAICMRNAIRDCFDLEFLLRKGIKLELSEQQKGQILKRIESYKREDYATALGRLLPKDMRDYYAKNGFKYLREALSQGI